jgi:hypothetical protein
MIFSMSGDDDVRKALKKLDPVAVEAIIKINMTEIYNRGKRPGGTPVDTGELRQSLGIQRQAGNVWVVGYTKEYAPHVEYGHRTVGGGYVKGQHYLRDNVNIQQKRIIQDIKTVASGMR